MKIMYFYASLRAGGAERMISALANYNAKQGVDVSIAVIDNLPSFYSLHQNVKLLNLWKLQNSQNTRQVIKNTVRLVTLTRRAFKEVRPNCVVCFGINYLVYALMAKMFLNIKLIGSERSNPKYSDNGFWHKMKKIASPFADGFIFQTNGAKKYYPKIVQKKSAVIPNGIIVDNLPADSALLSKCIPNSICAVGNLSYVKGFDMLIRAFAVFSEVNSSYRLTIYGEGTERAKLEELISKLGLNDKVILAGRISNVTEEISRREIFILSSRFEGMPNALIEGLACGCACISTNCDFGPNELIINEENGLLVPVDDINAMAAAMQKLASNPGLRKKIARNAVNIRNTHSIERIADKYLAYITRIAHS